MQKFTETCMRPTTLEEYQGQDKIRKALTFYIKAAKMREDCLDHTIIYGPSGLGKAQPMNTIIPTPDGNKKLSEIKVGDYIYDRKGKPTKVLGVFPQGIINNFKVTLKDGRYTYCNDEHLWSYYTSRGNLKTITLKEMMENGLKNNSGEYRYKIPLNKAIQYPEKDFKIHPYIIGAFLGEGCTKERILTISSETEEIPKYISSLLPWPNTCKRSNENNYSWFFALKNKDEYSYGSKTIKNVQTKHLFKDFIDEICVDAYEKRIPEIYFYGSIEQRLSLLQGLLDTDGNIQNNQKGRFGISFTSTSYKLIKDVQQLVYSLGYTTGKIGIDKRSYKYKNKNCFHIHISCSEKEKEKLFHLQRKKEIAKQAMMQNKRIHSYDRVAIVDIQKMEEKEEMVCIYVDNFEHLYLTNDFIVTHNTTLANIIANEMGQELITVSAPILKTVDDIRNVLLSLEENQILFIDEIHRLPKRLEEILYFAMEDFAVDIDINDTKERMELTPFTLIGATTSRGALSEPLRNRFQISLELTPYNEDHLTKIVRKTFERLNMSISDVCAQEIAKRGRGIPRIVNGFVRRIADFAMIMNEGVVDEEVIVEAFDFLGVDENGLTEQDRRYLSTLMNHFKLRPAGIDTLCGALNDDKKTIENTVEPYLIQRGYITKTPKGRVLTEVGRAIAQCI